MNASSQPSPTSRPSRRLPAPLLENIWMWSIFSAEKQFYFNGYAIKTANDFILIDPPDADESVLDALQAIALPTAIVLTNRDHERDAETFARHFHAPIYAPEEDADAMALSPKRRYTDGDILPGGLIAIALPHQKSPGETALYWHLRKILILGDALIGHPAGALTMLPPEKFVDLAAARQHLAEQLLPYTEIDSLLLGDGEPILHQAGAVLQNALNAFNTDKA